MEPEVLLAHLQALLGRAPDFTQYSTASQEHYTWLGQAHALIARWNAIEAVHVQTAMDFLPLFAGRERNIAVILGALHRAVADLELQVPAKQQSNFGAGDVYDFFRGLRSVLQSAESSLFIVDPYLDASIFDQYLSARKPKVSVRLLLRNFAEDVRIACDKYTSQYGSVVSARRSNAIHDRVIFTDDQVCWVLGQSVKDAAKAKPTYLVPLPPDVTMAKLEDYNSIWDGAGAI